MWVNEKRKHNVEVVSSLSKIDKLINKIRPHIVRPLIKSLKTENSIIHSPQLLSSNWIKKINTSEADIIHLHWFQNEMLSVADVGLINKPLIWTTHDMWPFCGAEHCSYDLRWQEGYNNNNRPPYEKGFDLNKWTWNRKKKYWRKKIPIISPSNWLGNCIKKSFLMRDWPVTIIPNPIDTNIWKPIDKNIARELLGLPKNISLIFFDNSGPSYQKGADLLLQALNYLYNNLSLKNLEILVINKFISNKNFQVSFPVRNFEYLHDNLSLNILYSAVDAVVFPSRNEAFGQIASEAQTCGTPVIAFDIGGPADILIHKKTGYLAKAYDIKDFANGIEWIIDHSRNNKINIESRNKAVRRFSNNTVAKKYIEQYDKLLKSFNA
jgi:glycosyltransferase involved in cell wall biosynthesis